MPKKRVLVLISGSGSNLQALIDQASANYEIVGVISNRPQAYGLTRAATAGIPTHVLDHKQFDSREAYDRELGLLCQQQSPDLLVLAGFMRILSPQFVQQFLGRLINIHPSLLPLYPGLDTHNRAILAGDKQHGATVHFVTEELDGGPAIVQGKTAITTQDTPATLAARVQHQIEHRIYPLAVEWFCQNRLVFKNEKAWLDQELLPVSGYQYTEALH